MANFVSLSTSYACIFLYYGPYRALNEVRRMLYVSITFFLYQDNKFICLFHSLLSFLPLRVTYNQTVITPTLTDDVNCNKYFYRNLLYVNNFYPLSEMCMMWSWYLANDFQFYVVVIILLLLSTRSVEFFFSFFY